MCVSLSNSWSSILAGMLDILFGALSADEQSLSGMLEVAVEPDMCHFEQ